LSYFLQNPSPEHIYAINWTIRYLFGTRFLGIQYSAYLIPGRMSPSRLDALVIASDASFADDAETRKSSHGFTIMLFGGLIVWRTVRQDTVITLIIEVELLGLAWVGKESMALKRLFRDI
jgi:hypothetical protein